VGDKSTGIGRQVFLAEVRFIQGAILLAAALAIGSFLATCVSRSARHVPVFGARRSYCAECGDPVPVFALVPLLGYIALRGRCATCGNKIDPLFPLMEAMAAIIVASALIEAGWTFSPRVAAGIAFGLALVFLGFHDLRTGRLPDAVTLPLLVAGLGFSFVAGPVSPVESAAGAALGGGAAWLLGVAYRRYRGTDGLGLGDVKLIAALGAWIGVGALPLMILMASGGALAVLAGAGIARGSIARNARISFGPFLALAGWVAWISGL
jgi:leader peptidase (prepilin peptidase)/N-methyltransferase